MVQNIHGQVEQNQRQKKRNKREDLGVGKFLPQQWHKISWVRGGGVGARGGGVGAKVGGCPFCYCKN